MYGSTLDGHMSIYQPSKPNDVAHTVIIKDVTEWIPYSPALARAYLLYGNDPVRICLHNAEVCREHKRPDLHKIWLLAAEILRTVVPLGTDIDEHKFDSNDPAAAETVELRKAGRAANAKKQLHTIDAPNKPLDMANDLQLLGRQRRDSGTGLDSDNELTESTKGRVQWGLHPLGRKLVDQLFENFLQLGDVQMLAMMSCVFREPFLPDKLPSEMLEGYNRNYETDVTQSAHSTNTMSKYEYFNNHYMHHPERYNYASAANFWPLPPMPLRISYTPTGQPSGNLMGPSPVQTLSTPSLPLPTLGGESYSSRGYFNMNFGSNSDPHNLTPPTPIGMSYVGHHEVSTDSYLAIMEGVNTTAIPGNRTSFLTTGDREIYPPNYNLNYKDHQRSQSVNFANNGSVKPRQNSLPLLSSSITSSNAPSPPVTPRRPSPSGYRTHSQTFAGKDGSEITSQNGIVVQMVNHQYFDSENTYSRHVALLNPTKAPQFDAYRIFYSDMLYRWGLFEQRAELLKFVSFAQGVSAGSVWREMRNATVPVSVPTASQSWNININPSASNADTITGGGRGSYVGSLQSKSTEAAHTQSNTNLSPPLPSSRIAAVFPQGAVEWLFDDREQHLEVKLLCYKCGSELGPPDNTCLECHRHRRHVNAGMVVIHATYENGLKK
ncbi:hypothetical protein BC937DRAFT_95266 [Endogone sp. FLAS-F59071]|nr:hypothetical protein BC937DRAFT_95266 [Endogone sp. FLAS-F59071]|eukprot:RUS13468.1 hypothetical protein BC937DRAFT_95266 [Endogone sp. FLAS-F59071]